MSKSVLEPANRMITSSTNTSTRVERPRERFEQMKAEGARLETFSRWPITFISPEDCSKAGFFFLHDGDKVQCAFCHGVAGEWEEGDNPLMEHKKHFPRCPFIRNLPVGNVPLDSDSDSDPVRDEEESPGVDVCGPYDSGFESQASSESSSASVRGAQPLDSNINDVTNLAIKVCGNGPVHRNLVTVDSRMKTFSNWPSSSGQTPKALAEAGFFYIGYMDHVKCFYCDGGLRNWEDTDDPWLEHARWFSKCTFVILNKGEKFVQDFAAKEIPPAATALKTPEASSITSEAENGNTNSKETNSQQANGNVENGLESPTCSKQSSISSKSSKCPSPDNTSEDENSNKNDKKDLEEELRKLREETQCKMCMDNRVDVVFLPCGHLVSCTRCATAISTCAVCRQPIKAYVKTYMS